MRNDLILAVVARDLYGASSQMPLMDLKNLQFFLEDRDHSKINLVDLRLT